MIYISDLKPNELNNLLARYGLLVNFIANSENIPGSYWGAPEAGIIKNQLYVRADTPVHSALHESCHYICMDSHRRENLHTDTGGDYDEENAVCYLQILLSNFLQDVGQTQLCQDMDAWGYTFRLGSAGAWFENDADDAYHWLLNHVLIDNNKTPTWSIRQ